MRGSILYPRQKPIPLISFLTVYSYSELPNSVIKNGTKKCLMIFSDNSGCSDETMTQKPWCQESPDNSPLSE